MPLKEAARLAGIDSATLRRWRHDDPTVGEAVRAARDAFLTTQLDRVHRAGERDWKAAAWLLERPAPGSYGKRHQVSAEPTRIAVEDAITREILGGEEDV